MYSEQLTSDYKEVSKMETGILTAGAMTTLTLNSINTLDKTDPRIIKAFKIPYAPGDIAYKDGKLTFSSSE